MTKNDTHTSNNRIVKNTAVLYLRMMFSMGITLYTSRAILQKLGIEDYGIYNVVGGVVSMFTVISGAMNTASQRYITYSLGKGDKGYSRKVFSNSVLIHIIIAVLIFIAVETVGLWFLNYKLVIPRDRLEAAFWVMQCSLLSVSISIWSVPYNAVIIAHERISAFAYISMIEVFLRLAIVLILPYFELDRLILYSILLLSVHVLMRFIYGQYSYRNFSETRLTLSNDKKLFKDMLSFAGWSMMGTVSGALYTQGLNILLNIFFGPMVNAARGISVQVQGAVHQFVNNFQMAVNPQITITYANEDIGRMKNLIFLSSKFSFYLLFAIILPLIIKTDFLFGLWLHEIPKWSISFTQLLLIIVLVEAMSNPLITSVQATGKIKKYQITINLIQIVFFPLTYIALKIGLNPNSVFVVQFTSCVATYISRVIFLKRIIDFPIAEFIKTVWTKIILVGLLSISISILLDGFINDSFIGNFAFISFTVIGVIISSYLFGLSNKERQYVSLKITNIFRKFRK